MKFSNRIAVFLLIMFVNFHKSEESRDVDDYDINIRNRGQINGRTIAEEFNGVHITDRNNQRDLLQNDGNMNNMGHDHRFRGSGNRDHLSTNNERNVDQDHRVSDKGNQYHFSTHNDDNIISGNNIRNRVQINGRTIGEGSNGVDITDGYKHNMDQVPRVSDKGNRYHFSTHNDDNIISGNNIRNRVQINGRTIGEGSKTDDLSNGYKQNMGHDYRVNDERNRDHLSTNKDRNMDHDPRVKGKGNRDHFSTNNDPNIDHDNRATGNGNRDRYHSHNNDNIISGNNIRNRVQINGKTIKAIKTVNDSNKKETDKQPTNEKFDSGTKALSLLEKVIPWIG